MTEPRPDHAGVMPYGQPEPAGFGSGFFWCLVE